MNPHHFPLKYIRIVRLDKTPKTSKLRIDLVVLKLDIACNSTHLSWSDNSLVNILDIRQKYFKDTFYCQSLSDIFFCSIHLSKSLDNRMKHAENTKTASHS